MSRLLFLAALIALPAFATDKPTAESPKATANASADADATATQTQQQGQQQTASSNQSQSQGNVQTIESERQAPSTFISTPGSTAPCVIANGWSVGVPGAGGGRNKSRVDPACWQEYLRQAEHERSKDAALLAIEREKLAIERDRVKLESLRLENCLTCSVTK